MTGSAVLSEDGRYRWSLSRWWSTLAPWDLWLMCNPSTADWKINDPTITRCTGFSRRFGSGGLRVVNAYGYRASKPGAMWAAGKAGVDIVGSLNDGYIGSHCRTTEGRVIVAWGVHPKPERVAQVIDIVRATGKEPLCLGTTKDGMPRHPLMLRNDAELQPWREAA